MRWLLTGALLSGAVLPRAEAADLPEVLKRGTLRALVVVSEEEAYFVSSRPDAPPGFDAEVLEGFARLHKLKLTIVPVSGWDALIPSLLKGSNLRGARFFLGFGDANERVPRPQRPNLQSKRALPVGGGDLHGDRADAGFAPQQAIHLIDDLARPLIFPGRSAQARTQQHEPQEHGHVYCLPLHDPYGSCKSCQSIDNVKRQRQREGQSPPRPF